MMGSVYWLVKIGNGNRIAQWIIENYPGINYICWNIDIPEDLQKFNVISRRNLHIPFQQATVISFQDFDNPDVDIKFKLMNSDIILDCKLEKPSHVW